ncbi:MAG: hypothetical protein IH984_12245 [Planctomycetes bacterium]|nr:hypothetical protein [Planctomycetota bacterium]
MSVKHSKHYFLAIIQLVVIGFGSLCYGQQLPVLEQSLPMLDREEFAICLITLDLKDSETVPILWTLYDEYILQLNTIRERYRQLFYTSLEQEKAYLKANPNIHDAWVDEGKDFGLFENEQKIKAEYKIVQESFRDDLKIALADERVETWLEIERTLKRKRLLSQMSVRSPIPWLINLVEIMEEVSINEDHFLHDNSLIEDYLSRLDIAIDQWNSERAGLVRIIWSNGISAQERINNDPKIKNKRRRAIRAFRRENELVLSVVNTNKEFSQLIADELAPDNQLQFTEAIQKKNYPFLFTPCPVELVFGYLTESELLDVNRRNQVRSIAKKYIKQQTVLRTSIIDILELPPPSQRELDRLSDIRSKAIAQGRDPWEVLGPHPITDSLITRRELSNEALWKLRNLFAEDEFIAAPMHIRLLLSWNN